jgi:hypothetical protein
VSVTRHDPRLGAPTRAQLTCLSRPLVDEPRVLVGARQGAVVGEGGPGVGPQLAVLGVLRDGVQGLLLLHLHLRLRPAGDLAHEGDEGGLARRAAGRAPGCVAPTRPVRRGIGFRRAEAPGPAHAPGPVQRDVVPVARGRRRPARRHGPHTVRESVGLAVRDGVPGEERGGGLGPPQQPGAPRRRGPREGVEQDRKNAGRGPRGAHAAEHACRRVGAHVLPEEKRKKVDTALG